MGLLAVMFVAESVFGPAGLVAAPLFYAYLKKSWKPSGWSDQPTRGRLQPSQPPDHLAHGHGLRALLGLQEALQVFKRTLGHPHCA